MKVSLGVTARQRAAFEMGQGEGSNPFISQIAWLIVTNAVPTQALKKSICQFLIRLVYYNYHDDVIATQGLAPVTLRHRSNVISAVTLISEEAFFYSGYNPLPLKMMENIKN